MSGWLQAWFWLVAASFAALCRWWLWHLRWTQRLPSLENLTMPQGVRPSPSPRVSVVLAARDEAHRLEGTIRRVLAQTARVEEVIVVDDRSTDATPQILGRLASEDARLKTLRVEQLPGEWLGKCHACHRGAELATGDWILFTDADCWIRDDVIVRALAVADRERADHITLTPGVRPATLAAAALHVAFTLTFSDWCSRVNRDKPRAFLGVGAFNLVRAEAYRQCGGYEALRLTVLDDVKLGLLLRRAGFRTRAFLGISDVECHWGTTVGDMIRVVEKNLFAAVDYRLEAVVGLVAITIGLWGGAFLGLLSHSWAGLAAGLSLTTVCIPGVVVTRRMGWSVWAGVAAPFGWLLLVYAVVNSTVVTLSRGGIRWRDTFYPLAILCRGDVRR